MSESDETQMEALRASPETLRAVGQWLVREADQRVKFFPQRVDEVDALMRCLASDLFRAASSTPGDTPE